MTMTVNESVDTLSPFAGPVSPILFGIEHEYNVPYDPDECCDCSECYDGNYEDCEERSEEFSEPSLPRDWEQHSEHCGWEVKTPPMHDIGEAMDVFRRLSRHFTWGHENCGYHIHLNADPANGPAVNVAAFAQNWLVHRNTLWRHAPSAYGGIGVRPEIGDRSDFAAPIPDDVMAFMARDVRYRELNWGSLEEHTTIEVRLGAATSNMEHFESWLRYVIAVGTMSLLSDDPMRDYAGLVAEGAYGRTNAAGVHLMRLGHTYETVIAMAGPITGAA